jgi:hypothetical protein
LIVIPEPTAQVVHFMVYSFYRIVIIIHGFNPSRFVGQPGYRKAIVAFQGKMGHIVE